MLNSNQLEKLRDDIFKATGLPERFRKSIFTGNPNSTKILEDLIVIALLSDLQKKLGSLDIQDEIPLDLLGIADSVGKFTNSMDLSLDNISFNPDTLQITVDITIPPAVQNIEIPVTITAAEKGKEDD